MVLGTYYADYYHGMDLENEKPGQRQQYQNEQQWASPWAQRFLAMSQFKPPNKTQLIGHPWKFERTNERTQQKS